MLLGIEVGIALGEYRDNNVANSMGLEIVQRMMSLVEVVLSASLLPRFSTLDDWLRKPRIFPRFIAALLLGPGVSGVLAAIYFHLHDGQGYLSAFDDWAAADALGIAAIMPLALSFDSAEMREIFRWRSIPKTVVVLALAFGCAVAVFSISRYPLLFLLFPALLLVDTQLDFAGSAIAVLVTSFIAVYYTTHGKGPFGVWPKDLAVSSNVALQIYVGFQLVALFPASIMILERKRMGWELRDTNAQLLLLASLDGLTGIANRRSFDEYFAQEWNRAIRLQTPLAFIMIDIDHFKQFNDLYGHHSGDQCLQAVAAALKGEVQRIQDHLARFGGEEFSLLLPHTDIDGAMHLAEKLRSAVSKGTGDRTSRIRHGTGNGFAGMRRPGSGARRDADGAVRVGGRSVVRSQARRTEPEPRKPDGTRSGSVVGCAAQFKTFVGFVRRAASGTLRSSICLPTYKLRAARRTAHRLRHRALRARRSRPACARRMSSKRRMVRR